MRRPSPAAEAPADEGGFALVAALLAALLFAFFAYAVLAADRGATAELDAQVQHARLEAAADAGLATAMTGLGGPENTRWPIDGRSKTLSIDDMQITATIEDERGKIPINTLKADQARRLLQAVGVPAAKLDRLVDSLLNWNDGEDRPNGAKALDYAEDGVRQRGGPIRTLDELAIVKGMDADLLARIAPALTVFPDGPFDPKTASPLVIKAMNPTGSDAPDAIIRAREQAGERTKLDPGPATSYLGRPLTVRINVQSPDGGVLNRATIIEMTGQHSHPFWIRSVD